MLLDFTISRKVKTVKSEANNHLRILDILGHFIHTDEFAYYSREFRFELTHLTTSKGGLQVVYHSV